MMRAAAVCLVVILAGCATAERRDPVTITETVTVQVPVRVACVDREEVKPLPPSAMPARGDVMQKAAGAVADADALYEWAKAAEIMLRNCSTSP